MFNTQVIILCAQPFLMCARVCVCVWGGGGWGCVFATAKKLTIFVDKMRVCIFPVKALKKKERHSDRCAYQSRKKHCLGLLLKVSRFLLLQFR